ncbi:monocarboxylate transporter 4-like [Octopus sinensis]|uniref:Monocarboxylate transporter 4-like n=1 Tax=Octopus sinensis TaxID=2607531 RepID=A0A7E6ERT3_9MOLL|nr:monocarboxylate transporter 4-like [Octopus sinensis]
MEPGETFGNCVKRKLSAISLYSNFSNISFQEDNPIFNRLSNDVNDFDNSKNDVNDFDNSNNDTNDYNTNAVNNGDCATNRRDIDDVNFTNNAHGTENDAYTGDSNLGSINLDENSSVTTASYLTLPSIFDEIMKYRGKSVRSSQRFDIDSLATTADTVYSTHSARPSLIGDRPLVLQDFLFAVAAFACHLFTIGIAASIGVIVIEWLHEFPESRTVLLSIPPMTFGITSAIGLFVGTLMNQIGGPGVIIIGGFFQGLMLFVSAFANSAFFLFVSVGLCFGIGCSLVYVTVFVVVGIYFGSRATIFIALLSTAGPIGAVVFPLIIPYIISVYNWNYCLFILSGISFNVCPLGLYILFCQNRANKANQEYIIQLPIKLKARKKLLDVTVFNNFMFNLFLLPLCLSCGFMNFTFSIYASYMDNKGFSLMQTTQQYSILCSASIIARLSLGVVLRLTRWRFVYIYTIVAIGFGITMCISTVLHSYELLAVCNLFAGLFHGGPCGLYPIAILDFVGPEKYSSGIGITETANGVITIIEGFLAGVLTDLTGTYNLAMYIFGGVSIFFNILLLILLVNQYLKDNEINLKLF